MPAALARRAPLVAFNAWGPVGAGDVSQMSRGKQRTLSFMKAPPRLTVVKVFEQLTSIAHMSGGKVQAKKVEVIKGLLVACQNSEAKYIIRALGQSWTAMKVGVTLDLVYSYGAITFPFFGAGGKLRINLAEQTVIMSLAQAFVQTPPCKGAPWFPPWPGLQRGDCGAYRHHRRCRR